MKAQLGHRFEEIVSVENLLEAWSEFAKGKRRRQDVQKFSFRLMDNIFELHRDLRNHTYKHGGYQDFYVFDPKPRHIHKATVRDRLLHHALYRVLYPFFEKTFIADSFSCQRKKGTHRALNRFCSFAYKVGGNNTRTCWVLKCDIKKFFESVNQGVLLNILREYLPDQSILWLLGEVISSFSSKQPGVGLPLGNLTSQLFVNIYMNEFDQFVKHKVCAKYYIRYADDFIILFDDRPWLEAQIPHIQTFLERRLKLILHPGKVFIKTLTSGVDFLGWIHFPDHRVLRTSTKRRMMRRIADGPRGESIVSYLGLLNHGNTRKLKEVVLNHYILHSE